MSRIGLLHADTLLGREIANRLGGRAGASLRLLTTEPDAVGTLLEAGDEAGLLQLADADTLAALDALVAAGGSSDLEAAGGGPPLLIASPDRVLAGPAVVVPGAGDLPAEPWTRGAVLQSPWAGTVALGHLLGALRALEPREVFATVIEPVTALGQAGLDELLEQTRALLAFQANVPTGVLERRLAFNAVPLPGGEQAVVSAQLRQLLGLEPLPVHLVRVRAGFFHGTGLTVTVRFAGTTDPARVRQLLTSAAPFRVAGPGELPGLDEIAGSEEILVVPLEAAESGTVSFWLLVDGLVLGGAVNTVLALESLLPSLFESSTH